MNTPSSSSPLRPSLVRHLLAFHPFLLGLAIRLVLSYTLPFLLDSASLLPGVRYTDVDYDVFTDAADHVASGRSPYERHTYRYTPFLAAVLALGVRRGRVVGGGGRWWWWWTDRRYFGRIIFCVSDALCGLIILALRRRRRRRRRRMRHGFLRGSNDQRPSLSEGFGKEETTTRTYCTDLWNDDVVDASWWLYNPLPINICTRGSAESFVVILPVLATLVLADEGDGDGDGGAEEEEEEERRRGQHKRKTNAIVAPPLKLRSVVAGVCHGVGIHFKLYPVIYTASYMVHFARLEASSSLQRPASPSPSPSPWLDTLDPIPTRTEKKENGKEEDDDEKEKDGRRPYPFPWARPGRLLRLAYLWMVRLLSPSSVLFLVASATTFAALTYAAVAIYGRVALEEGVLYHLSRVDHRHNYSMYWYWIYLARDRIAAEARAAAAAAAMSTNSGGGGGGGDGGMAALSRLLTLPQLGLLLYTSLGTAPYDLPFALFLQTFLFVAHNKVITAQYFTWYLCLLPLCSESILWNTKRMRVAFGLLGLSVVVWLGSAYCLEMRGLSVYRFVWMASMGFFFSNVNLMNAIMAGYRGPALSASVAYNDAKVDAAVKLKTK